MKYYSEVTNRVYDTVETLKAEEKKILDEKAKKEAVEAAKRANREAKAKEVEAALEAAKKAQSEAAKKLSEFCKEFGSFHTTVSTKDLEGIPTLFDFMNWWL